jgi:hypothetical protein
MCILPKPCRANNSIPQRGQCTISSASFFPHDYAQRTAFHFTGSDFVLQGLVTPWYVEFDFNTCLRNLQTPVEVPLVLRLCKWIF